MEVRLDRGDIGRRIDLVVHRHLAGVPGATRTRIQSWIEEGRVQVNGGNVPKSSTRIAASDVVTVALPATRARLTMSGQALPLDVLYEDAWLLAINKPAGMVAHPTYRHENGTAMNALLWHARDWPKDARPSLVGRLDKLTSGIVLVAKTRAVHAALQKELSRSESEKDYLAVVYGRMTKARGLIDRPLGRDGSDRRRVVVDPSGAPSQTRFERLARVAAPSGGLTLVRCRLLTGRMHQIRVHLASEGFPIVGDPVYGVPRWSAIAEAELSAAVRSFNRQALHAWRLVFRHPIAGARTTIHAPIPEDLETLLTLTGLSAKTMKSG
jgi:23S rRNA pseudouridine1911/1915/1917 synthase